MVRLPFMPFKAQRHPRYCAILCLGAFMTGCVEQTVVLTSDKFEAGYEVVHYGPKVRVTDGMGREISTEGMFEGGASMNELFDPATISSEDRVAAKAAVKFLFVRHGGTTADTLTTTFQGTSITMVVTERSANGAPKGFKVLGNNREVIFATNPDIGLGTMTVKEAGAVQMVVEVSPAGTGQGSFTGVSGSANLTEWAKTASPRALFRDMPAMQEGGGVEEGDSDIDDASCNSIALGGLAGLFAFISAHALIGSLIYMTAAIGGGLTVLGVMGVLAIILFYKWWTHEEDEWSAGSPSCESKYGDLGGFVGDHLVGGFTRMWNAQFGS